MDNPAVYVSALILLVCLSAFFSASEAALFSLNRSQINQFSQQPGPRREVARMLSRPRRALITILIGNLLVNVFATSAATAVAVGVFGDKGVGIAFGFMSVVIIVFGEILPKVVAINRPRRSSVALVYPLKAFYALFYPAQIVIAHFTDRVIDLLKRRLGAVRKHFSSDELLTALNIGRDEGYVGGFEYELLSNIIRFKETVVREIMTPSINVFSLPIDMNPEEMEEKILQSEYSRVPVYGETADDIRGVLHVKNFAARLEGKVEFDVRSVMRKPYFVPESKRISELFTELGRHRTQLAVVIDEHGSYVGIVTMEDILEELVGEIRDSKEPRAEDYSLLGDRRIVVQGTMRIEDFNRVFEADLADEDHETIAGYVLGALGSIPGEGETIEIGDLRFHIISAQPNRIRKMRVEKK